MVGGPGLRFALEAAFLIALAVAAGLAELSPTTIVLVMGAAWLLVAVIEWLAWREAPARDPDRARGGRSASGRGGRSAGGRGRAEPPPALLAPRAGTRASRPTLDDAAGRTAPRPARTRRISAPPDQSPPAAYAPTSAPAHERARAVSAALGPGAVRARGRLHHPRRGGRGRARPQPDRDRDRDGPGLGRRRARGAGVEVDSAGRGSRGRSARAGVEPGRGGGSGAAREPEPEARRRDLLRASPAPPSPRPARHARVEPLGARAARTRARGRRRRPRGVGGDLHVPARVRQVGRRAPAAVRLARARVVPGADARADEARLQAAPARGRARGGCAPGGGAGARAWPTWRESEPEAAALPASVPAPGGGWYEAIAAPIRAPSEPTECGYTIDSATVGVAHPVLPCEVKLFVRYGLERGADAGDRPAAARARAASSGSPRGLARALGATGTVRVRWRYAAAPGDAKVSGSTLCVSCVSLVEPTPMDRESVSGQAEGRSRQGTHLACQVPQRRGHGRVHRLPGFGRGGASATVSRMIEVVGDCRARRRLGVRPPRSRRRPHRRGGGRRARASARRA